MKYRNLTIIIPVLNEEKTIKKVVESLQTTLPLSQIIISDDGSIDNTENICRELSKKSKNIFYLKKQKNEGKGSAIRHAASKIRGKYVLIQDADLEYDPKDIIQLFEKVKSKNKNQVIYGSRLLGSNPHAYMRTYLGNVIITKIANLLFRTNLTDSYTCYKLMPKKIFMSLNLISNGFEIEAEMTAKLLKKGVPLIEMPISFAPRRYNEGKKIKYKDFLIGVKTYFQIWFDKKA